MRQKSYYSSILYRKIILTSQCLLKRQVILRIKPYHPYQCIYLQIQGHVGDSFMQQIQPIAAYIPYMTTVGNHESSG